MTAEVIDYVLRMGAKPTLVTLAQQTPPWSVRWIKSEEAKSLDVDNSRVKYLPLSLKSLKRGAVAEVKSSDDETKLGIFCGRKSQRQYASIVRLVNATDKAVLNTFKSSVSQFDFAITLNGKQRRVAPKIAAVNADRISKELSIVGVNFVFSAEEMALLRNATAFYAYDGGRASRASMGYIDWLEISIDGDRQLIDLALRNCIDG